MPRTPPVRQSLQTVADRLESVLRLSMRKDGCDPSWIARAVATHPDLAEARRVLAATAKPACR